MLVFLIVADSLRADAPGFAGGAASTPVMDGLAREGTRFAGYFASGAWTVPSLISMLTGSYAHEVGICRWRHPYPAGRPNLLTAFAAAGFEVRCVLPYPRWGFLTIPGRGVVGNSQDPEAVIAALRGRPDQDRLVVILHWWIHLPYLQRELPRKTWHTACDFILESLNRHPERLAAKTEETYLKAVSHFSEQILPRYLDAAVAGGGKVMTVLTADHGETWGRSLPLGRRIENVYDLHGRWIADETVHVPLVVHGWGAANGIPAGQVLGGMAGGVDLGPTLTELAGVPWPGPALSEGLGLITRPSKAPAIAGRSLASCILEGKPAPRREVMTVSSHNTLVPDNYPANGREMWRTMALRTTEAWYIWDGVEGRKTVNPLDENAPPAPDKAPPIFERLEAHWRQAVDSAEPVERKLAETLREDLGPIREKLRSLGYLD